MYRAHNPDAPGMHNTAPRMDSHTMPSTSSGMDSHTRVSYKRNPGYFERVGGSFCGAFVGFIILVAAFPVLFLNEGRAVQTAKSLNEGLRSVIELQSTDNVFESWNNKLVYLSGSLRTDWPLDDREYGITVHAVKLHRNVDMYQWVEHKTEREHNEGDRTRVETTYSYSTEWKAEVLNSGSFNNPSGHNNPNSMVVQPRKQDAQMVHVGQFQLSKGLIGRISDFKKYHPRQLPSGQEKLKIVDGYIYDSENPKRPMVGDIRLSFSYAGVSGPENNELGQPDKVSIIARQNGQFLSSYQTDAGDQLELLYPGIMTAKEIFDSEHSANSILTWVIRFFGWLMMFIAMQMIMDIIRQIVSFIPIIRELVSLGTSLVSLTFATSLALTTIALGWIRYRPLLAMAILMGAAIPIYISRKKAEKEKGHEETKGFY